MLKVTGSFDYTIEDARVNAVKILGAEKPSKSPSYGSEGGEKKNCGDDEWTYENGVITIEMDQKLDGEFTVEM